MNEVSELSIALTRLMLNSPHLTLTRLVAISDHSVGNIIFGNVFKRLFGFPLKTESTPTGLFTKAKLFELLEAIFSYLFFNADEV